jgi:phosphate-selective porin
MMTETRRRTPLLSSITALTFVVGLPLVARAQAQTEAPAAPPLPPITETPPPPAAPPLPATPPPAPPQEAPGTVAVVPASPSPAAEAAAGGDPIAGVSDQSMFLRSPDNQFVFFPNGRLQNDIYIFHSSDKVPNDTFLIRRARLELQGWIGPWFYFHLAGDFAAGVPAVSGVAAVQSNLNTTDDFVAIAPFGTIAMLQIGQYDAPFTLENRTSDKYFDFMERSITVRAWGIPDNKEMGAMVHGYNENRNFMYSFGLFNGDGQNYKNIDNQFDWMGRAWIAPLSFLGDGPLHDIEVGGSFWTGDRANTLAPTNLTTQAGFTFLNFGTYNAAMGSPLAGMPMQLRQVGRLNAYAFEVNAPYAHKYGLRYEFVWRHSPLSEETVPANNGNGAGTIQGGANLQGYSMYGELFFWALGDDRIIGDQQGIEPYPKFKKFGIKPPVDGLMLAFRFEYLNVNLTQEADAMALMLGDKAVGRTKVNTYELGINYWHSRRYRATFNYVFNHFDQGSDATAQIKAFPSPNEQEFLFRFAIAL